MTTKVYGASDDLIEFEGDVYGEVGYYASEGSNPALVAFSDGTLLTVNYGKNELGVWEIKLLRKGELFQRIDTCDDEDADPHSDVAHFASGLKWAYAATDWQRVK
jgi:hypothetical protein